MKRRILSLLLAFCLVFTFVPTMIAVSSWTGITVDFENGQLNGFSGGSISSEQSRSGNRSLAVVLHQRVTFSLNFQVQFSNLLIAYCFSSPLSNLLANIDTVYIWGA